MRIAFPPTNKNIGPLIFMRRLRESIERQKLAKTVAWWNPLRDISLFAIRAKGPWKHPYVLRLDGIYFDSLQTLGANQELNAPIFSAIAGANGLVFNAEHCAKLVDSFYPGELPTYTVINSGVNLTQFTNPQPQSRLRIRKQLGIPEDAFVLVGSAHWRKWKRLQSYIDVHRTLYALDPSYHLLILGKNPDADLSGANIHYGGEIPPEHIQEWYNSGDIFLLLSWLEASANTNIEAIASGLPVVIANSGGSGEIVQSCQAGIVSACDPEYAYGKEIPLYDPPQPNIERICHDVQKVRAEYEAYKGAINREPINIDKIAKRYVEFMQVCL